MMVSINRKIMVEPYRGSNKLKAEIKGGFATVKQKSSLIGLKTKMDANIKTIDGTELAIGSGHTVFFKEEDLHTQSWAKQTFTAEGIEGEFIMADSAAIVMVSDGSK